MQSNLFSFIRNAALICGVSAATTSLTAQSLVITNQAAGAAATASSLVPTQAVAVGPLGQKDPGKIRVCVANPKAQLGQAGSGGDPGGALRSLLVTYLAGPGLEVQPLIAMLPSQIDAEAQQKECSYVVHSVLTQKQASGGMSLLRVAAMAAPMLGVAGGLAGAVAASAAATAGSAATVMSISSAVKAKGEISLNYNVVSPGKETPLLEACLKSKAKQDGEDVITPLVEQATTAILGQVLGKKQ
jgi:acyl-coenzyme A thioesterase PaaI-like protein